MLAGRQGHRFFSLGPGVSCCYWVLCSPTMPCMARVMLPSIKHQAPGTQAPSTKAREPQAERALRLGLGLGLGLELGRLAVPSGDGVACGLCISPSHRHGADKFNIGFHAPPSRRSQKEGRGASLRLPRPPPSTPPQKANPMRSVNPILLNPALNSYVLRACTVSTPQRSQRKGNF